MHMCWIYSSLNLLLSVHLIMDSHKSSCFILESCSVTKIEKLWHKMSILNKTSNRHTECIRFLQILLFPEGTDLTAGSQQRSHQFASSHQLDHYYQVLHPKTTGFVFLVQRMRQSKFFFNWVDFCNDINYIRENLLAEGKYPWKIFAKCCWNEEYCILGYDVV